MRKLDRKKKVQAKKKQEAEGLEELFGYGLNDETKNNKEKVGGALADLEESSLSASSSDTKEEGEEIGVEQAEASDENLRIQL
mgnify:CR=1 FL=1